MFSNIEMILGCEANIGLIYYGPKWSWAEMVMGRNGHGPKWLWAEMTRNLKYMYTPYLFFCNVKESLLVFNDLLTLTSNTRFSRIYI